MSTVYDVHEGFFDHPPDFVEAYQAWLRQHGIEPNSTFRTEHHVIDAPLVRAFQYDRDADGRIRIDPATDQAAVRRPFDVLATTPPPRPEDYA